MVSVIDNSVETLALSEQSLSIADTDRRGFFMGEPTLKWDGSKSYAGVKRYAVRNKQPMLSRLESDFAHFFLLREN